MYDPSFSPGRRENVRWERNPSQRVDNPSLSDNEILSPKEQCSTRMRAYYPKYLGELHDCMDLGRSYDFMQ